MTFLFAYFATLLRPPGWPVHLIYLTETTFVAVVFTCILIALFWKGRRTRYWRDTVAAAGGISAGFGLIMPFELAPFFFGVRGEWMMATITLNIFYMPAAALFVFLFAKFMKIDRSP